MSDFINETFLNELINLAIRNKIKISVTIDTDNPGLSGHPIALAVITEYIRDLQTRFEDVQN